MIHHFCMHCQNKNLLVFILYAFPCTKCTNLKTNLTLTSIPTKIPTFPQYMCLRVSFLSIHGTLLSFDIIYTINIYIIT